jgi:hypothetical protein
MSLSPSLNEVLSRPSPEALWHLRADLLEQGLTDDSRQMKIVNAFYDFANQLVASSTAREYSHLASILDMAAVAGVAVQNLLAEKDTEEWWQRFMTGAVSEGMMVLAARQYVKAWEEEMQSDFNKATWFLAQEYWHLSNDLQPELAPARRRELVDQLFLPLTGSQLDGTAKAGLIARLFQVLLLSRLLINSQ